MKELGITKGETFALRNQPVERNGFYIETDSAYIGEVGGGYLSLDQYKAIGELLIDGANTAQKCGLLPSELLRQRDELKEAFNQMRQYWSLIDSEADAEQIAGSLWEVLAIAEAAIKNTDG